MSPSAADELARRLGEYPEEARSFFEEAFATASRLTEDTREHVLAALIESLRGGTRRLNGKVIRSIANLSEREAEQLASVYSIVIGLLAEISVTEDEFVSQARNILFTDEYETIVRSIIHSVCARQSKLSGLLDRANLANDVLPSFSGMGVAVDLRIRFVDGSVTNTVPVALILINTDIRDKELSFQISRSDLGQMINRLQTCLQDLKKAESFELTNV
jgi:hypothetical protein